MLPNFLSWNRISLVIASVLTAIALSTRLVAASEFKLTPTQMREDLIFLKSQWAPLDKSFTNEQRQAFDQVTNEAMAAADTLSSEEFALEIMRATAISRNGHTNANAGQWLRDLPVRAWWFADGLYIVKTHPQFTHLLGARIDKLGSLPSDEALQRVAPFISGTDQRIRFLSAGYLTSPDILKRIGAIANTAETPLTLRLRDGSVRVENLAPVSSFDPGDERKAGLNRGYAVLIPDDVNLPSRWPHIRDNVPDGSLIYSKRTDVSASWLDEKHQILYIRIDSITSLDDTPLVQKFAGVINTFFLPAQPKYTIVDLRFNNGGDFFNSILFSQALPRLTPPGGRIFVLIGRATYSAGIVTAAMLKGAGPENVTFIGETMGDNGQFWAEGKKLTLPNSHIGVRYSTQFEDYEKGCTDPTTCYWATVAFGPRNISLTPEVKVGTSFSDYASGRDPVLEKARALTK